MEMVIKYLFKIQYLHSLYNMLDKLFHETWIRLTQMYSVMIISFWLNQKVICYLSVKQLCPWVILKPQFRLISMWSKKGDCPRNGEWLYYQSGIINMDGISFTLFNLKFETKQFVCTFLLKQDISYEWNYFSVSMCKKTT